MRAMRIGISITAALTTTLLAMAWSTISRADGAEPAVSPRPSRGDADWLLPLPDLDVDPRVPTLKDVVGHGWAEDISTPAQIDAYVRALARAAPDRARLVTYGASWEGRPLSYLVITSAENLRRLEEIRASNLRIADPRLLEPGESARIRERLPALVWIAHSIHGNETSPADAALLTAYHLLADRSARTVEWRRRAVVFIDPLENPDGRQRFVQSYREMRGVFPQDDPLASERAEPWPGGRSNHYLFDLNRDWFLQSQAESRGRVAAYLRWQPHIFVDAHEMGRNNHFYFSPPREPINPRKLETQRKWSLEVGRHHAAWFDRFGFPYTTREMFDAFYPGYGSEWPVLQGATGILWEQAGVRGLVVRRDDEAVLAYHDGVRHHYVSAVATIEAAVLHRDDLLADFEAARSAGVRLGKEGPVRHLFLLEGSRPGRARRLARVLLRNGVEIARVRSELRVAAVDDEGRAEGERTVPAGSYHIDVAQPAGRLVRALLDRHVDMGEDFVERQLQRQKRRLSDEIYDVTAWSLPLAFGVECVAASGLPELEVESERWAGAVDAREVAGGAAKLAYLVAAEDDTAMIALSRWLRSGLRVHVIDRETTLGGVEFPRGTLLLRVAENPASLHARVREAARDLGLRVHATDTGFVTRGAHLGGPHVRWIRPPRVLLAMDRPARYSAGHTWYLFDRVLEYPVTRIAARHLAAVELDRYDVLILPDGDWTGAYGPDESATRRIRAWVREGGTLVLLAGAAAWASREETDILSCRPVQRETPWTGRPNPDPSPGSDAAAPGGGAGSSPPAGNVLKERPLAVPGAFLRARVDDHHWLTQGVGPRLDVLLDGRLILEPIRPTDGRDLVTFESRDRLLASGFCWPSTLDLLAGTPYVVYRARGKGHVVAFTDDPAYRAMYPAVQRLLVNAALLGPGH